MNDYFEFTLFLHKKNVALALKQQNYANTLQNMWEKLQ